MSDHYHLLLMLALPLPLLASLTRYDSAPLTPQPPVSHKWEFLRERVVVSYLRLISRSQARNTTTSGRWFCLLACSLETVTMARNAPQVSQVAR